MEYSECDRAKENEVQHESACCRKSCHHQLELQYMQSFSHISRTLNVCPVLSITEEVFSMCEYGEVESLQDLFGKKIVSPFASDIGGWTLLHVGALFISF